MSPWTIPVRQRHHLLYIFCGCLLALVILTIWDNSSKYVRKFSSETVLPALVTLSTPTPLNDPKWTYETTSSLCKGDTNPYMAEDLFCKKKPNFLANYKNPCWLDARNNVQCMPYFHLLGADKCGSTDLFNRILQHPEVEPAECGLYKECYFWCWNRYGIWMKDCTRDTREPFDKYLEMFNQASASINMREVDGYHGHITGEGTPMDLWDFRGWPRIPQNENKEEPQILTPHLMRHMYPNPKLIVILRNPAERLYSDYFFLGYGSSSTQFHKDSIRAITMIQNCLKTRSMRQCIFDMDMYANLPMRIHISLYSVFMKEWMAVFPRESFLVLRNEDYGRDIKSHMATVFNFLNISRLSDSNMDILSNAKRKHVTQSKKDKGAMLNATRAILNNFFAPFNKELANLLQDDRFLWNDAQH